MPELPGAMRERFTEEYDLSDYDAAVLTQSKDLANYFELICAVAGAEQAKPATNLLIGDFASALDRDGIAITEAPVSPPQLAVLLHRIADGTISNKIAKEVFAAMWEEKSESPTLADELIESKGL